MGADSEILGKIPGLGVTRKSTPGFQRTSRGRRVRTHKREIGTDQQMQMQKCGASQIASRRVGVVGENEFFRGSFVFRTEKRPAIQLPLRLSHPCSSGAEQHDHRRPLCRREEAQPGLHHH